MDETTTKMCRIWEGRIGYARVLVEIDAEKEIKDKIVIAYKGKNIIEGKTKTVTVEYAWKPSLCSHCKVFGYDVNRCMIKPKNNVEESTKKVNEEGLTVVHNRKVRTVDDASKRMNGRYGQNGNNVTRRNGVNQIQNMDKRHNNKSKVETKGKEKILSDTSMGTVKENVMNTNRSTLLDELVEDTEYYMDKKELMDAANEIEPEEDVMDSSIEEGYSISKNEIEGEGGNILK
ncbi:ATPase, F1/V1/A1 complex, alpha/beta subunit [Tanacetum coccineum]